MVLSCPVSFVLWKSDYLLEIDLFKADFQLVEHSLIRTKFLSAVEARITGSLLYIIFYEYLYFKYVENLTSYLFIFIDAAVRDLRHLEYVCKFEVT